MNGAPIRLPGTRTAPRRGDVLSSGQFPWALRALIALGFAIVALSGCGESPPPAAPPPAPEVTAGSMDAQAPLTVLINTAPTFDTQERWSDGYRVAKGTAPGVVVGPGGDNPNVFAQPFTASPAERFKVVARATSGAGPKARARIQINWSDAAGRFLAVSSRTFEVSTTETVVEEVVSAPAGTASGTLYVVADGSQNVVRYLEMRLLGGSHRAPLPAARAVDVTTPPVTPQGDAEIPAVASVPSGIPRPADLAPLDGSGRKLSVAESQYYFYQAGKALQRKARERGMDFIMYVMPDYNISRLMPAIEQLRREGVKVLAYEPQGEWTSGVDTDWYWQQADSHWTEAAVRLTADEVLRMWATQSVANRSFSKVLMESYARGFAATSDGLVPTVGGSDR